MTTRTGQEHATGLLAVLLVSLAVATACEEDSDWQRVSGIGKRVELNAIWGASADDVWAVGEREGEPVIWHRTAGGWSEQIPPDVAHGLDDVWGTDGEVWVAGHGGVYRLSGGVWEGWPEVDAVALWGAGPDAMVAAGSRRVWRFDGESWTEEPNAYELADYEDLELVGVWGSAPDAVWVVGGRVVCECGATTALYGSATTWSLVSMGTEMFVKDVWGAGPSDVFAVGGAVFSEEGSGIFRYDGQSWTRVGSGKSEFLTGVWGSSATDVFAVGMDGDIRHFDGTSWRTENSGTGRHLRGVWGTADGSIVYAVGTGGTILRHER